MYSFSESYGLPAIAQFASSGIWDAFYYPSWQERGVESPAQAYAAESRPPAWGLLNRQCAMLHVGAGGAEPARDSMIRNRPQAIHELLEQHRNRLLGVARLNGSDVARTLAAMDEWIVRGPMVGVCFPAVGPGAVACNHANFDPLVRKAAEAGALIILLCRYVAGEEDSPDLSTPSKVAELAARHPTVPLVCGHAGGDWEKGIRAVRGCPNVLVETSGFDPTSGFIELAVRELGADRIVFGSHLPGRSLGTELSKIVGAAISDRERSLIFAGNLRRLLAPILRRKGLPD